MPSINMNQTLPANWSRVIRTYSLDPTGSESTTTTNGQGTSRFRSVIRISTNTPGFRRPRKDGEEFNLPINPFVFEEIQSILPIGIRRTLRYYGHCTYEETVTSGNLAASGDSPWFVFGQALSAAESAALDGNLVTKIRNGLKNQTVNIAQMYGERRQTANLLATTAVRLSSGFRALKSGNLKGMGRALGLSVSASKDAKYRKRFAKSPSQAASSAWLEYAYGWSPLLNDVYGSAELLAQKFSRQVIDKVTARVQVKRKLHTQHTPSVFSVAERSLTKTMYVWFGTPGYSHTLAQVGLTNPAHLAWELLPYSFVVDWFIPIGNYLASLDATLGLQFIKGGTTSFARESYQQFENRSTGSNSIVPYPTCSGVATGYEVYDKVVSYGQRWKVTCVRTPLTEFPGPSFPSFKNPLSMTHAANAIALLTQTFKR